MEWENALGRLNFQKSGFLTHPNSLVEEEIYNSVAPLLEAEYGVRIPSETDVHRHASHVSNT